MVSFGPKLTGTSLSVLGWVLSVISCALPMWTVSNTGKRWGLWTRCVSRSTGQMQCPFHQFIHQELQTVRVLSVVAIIVGMLGVYINMVGAKCISYIQNERVKARLMASSGGVFITAALVQLVLVFWTVHTILWYFDYPKWKMGVALYLGWAASVLMLVGGSILCCICPPQEDKPRKYNTHGQNYIEYSATPRSTAQSSDKKKDEV